MKTSNIFHIETMPAENEVIEKLFEAGKNISIERIISNGQVSPENFWYDQTSDEWVLLLQGNATIEFENAETTELTAGNYLFIEAHRKHRIIYTSSTPPCIWLAVHVNSESGE